MNGALKIQCRDVGVFVVQHLVVTGDPLLSSLQAFKDSRVQEVEWVTEMGHVVSHFRPSTWEQKVHVSHSEGARGGGSTSRDLCPGKESLKTGNSVAQDFCNTKDCPPALALGGHSQQSASYSPDQSMGFIVCLLSS